MKIIIKNNIANEITSDDKNLSKIAENSTIYEWQTLDGEELEVYDLEWWLLRPHLKYLLEWETRTWIGKKIILLIIIIGLPIIIITGAIMIFGGSDKAGNIVPVLQSTNNNPNNEEFEQLKNELEKIKKESNEEIEKILKEKAKSEKIEVTKKTSSDNLDLYYQNKDLAYSNKLLVQENEKIKEENQNLKSELEIVKKENQNLKSELDVKKIREKNAPDDSFIYYLGDYLFNMCETEKVNQKCLELYYKFLNYNE